MGVQHGDDYPEYHRPYVRTYVSCSGRGGSKAKPCLDGQEVIAQDFSRVKE